MIPSSLVAGLKTRPHVLQVANGWARYDAKVDLYRCIYFYRPDSDLDFTLCASDGTKAVVAGRWAALSMPLRCYPGFPQPRSGGVRALASLRDRHGAHQAAH